MCICINTSVLSLTILCMLLLTVHVYLRQQHPIPVAEYPLHVSAHRWCVSASTASLIILCMPLLTVYVYLHQQRPIPLADHSLRVSTHRWCVSASTESHSSTDYPLSSCSQFMCICLNSVSILLLTILCAFLLTGGVYLHQQHFIPVAYYPCVHLLTVHVYLCQLLPSPVADHSLRVSALTWCISVSTVPFPLLIIDLFIDAHRPVHRCS